MDIWIDIDIYLKMAVAMGGTKWFRGSQKGEVVFV
jgi:hypothetical protein